MSSYGHSASGQSPWLATLDAVTNLRAGVRSDRALHHALIIVDEQTRGHEVHALLLQIEFDRCRDRIGRAAADLSLVVDCCALIPQIGAGLNCVHRRSRHGERVIPLVGHISLPAITCNPTRNDGAASRRRQSRHLSGANNPSFYGHNAFLLLQLILRGLRRQSPFPARKARAKTSPLCKHHARGSLFQARNNVACDSASDKIYQGFGFRGTSLYMEALAKRLWRRP